MGSKGTIVAISMSKERGIKKKNVGFAELKEDFGILGDAHSRQGDHRQVSILSMESIDVIKNKGINVEPGDFAENITTKGIDLLKVSIGQRLIIGENVLLEITQIGKECKNPCRIYQAVGDCVMPREGLFVRVLKGGIVAPGDSIYFDKEKESE